MTKHISLDQIKERLEKSQDSLIPVANNTSAYGDGDLIRILLHGHHVVAVDRNTGSVQVDSCRYRTVTTKSRLNWYLPTGCYIYQDDYVWYIHTPLGTWEFHDGALIESDGAVSGSGPSNQEVLAAYHEYQETLAARHKVAQT
jgi:hypothetical protein